LRGEYISKLKMRRQGNRRERASDGRLCSGNPGVVFLHEVTQISLADEPAVLVTQHRKQRSVSPARVVRAGVVKSCDRRHYRRVTQDLGDHRHLKFPRQGDKTPEGQGVSPGISTLSWQEVF